MKLRSFKPRMRILEKTRSGNYECGRGGPRGVPEKRYVQRRQIRDVDCIDFVFASCDVRKDVEVQRAKIKSSDSGS